MWEYIGLIKNKKLLLSGLKKIKIIKTKSKILISELTSIIVKILFLIFDLKSSLLRAEATIISTLERNESRVAHQRIDFPKLDESFSLIVK